MANFGQLLLTNLGIQEQYKAQAGIPLKFKRIGMGSGNYTGNIMALTKLVSENVSVDISKGYMQNNAFTVEGFFSNEGLQTGFAWREIGVFVEDSNGKEVLYCYANAGDSYDYIPATADERYSKYIRVATAIGNASNVSIVEKEGFIYVDIRAFEELKTEVTSLHPTKEVSGTAVVIEDSANLPFAGLKIYGKSTQDGDPTPEAPVEIVSVENPTVTVSGKNLLPVNGEATTWNGITFTPNPDGTVSASGKATELAYRNFTATLPKGDYYVSGCPAGGDAINGYFIRVVAAAVNGGADETVGDDIGSGLYFSLAETSNVIVRVVVRKDANVNIVFKPMICPASIEDKSFEKYVGVNSTLTGKIHGIPVTSGGNYTDANGQQWICDEIDFTRGVYVQRIQSVTYDGDEVWAKSGTYSYFTRTPSSLGVQPMCNKLTARTSESQPYIRPGITGDGIQAIIVSFGAESASSAEEFKALLSQNPLEVQYALATPVETTLTDAQMLEYRKLATYNPHTTILNDSGAWMDATYITKTYEAVSKTVASDIVYESAEYPGCRYRVVDGEIEWINSPSVNFKKYRTVERVNGAPVYVMGYRQNGSGNNSYSSLLPCDMSQIVSIDFFCTDSDIKYSFVDSEEGKKFSIKGVNDIPFAYSVQIKYVLQ